MKKYLLFVWLLISFIACRQPSSKQSILSGPNEISADEYRIQIDKDTLLITKNGALIDIPKGSLESSNKTVTLEIKEAYNLEQMIRAGLTTKAGEELLSSGGMIYINAKAGQEVKITRALRIALPTSSIQEKMSLYKGETDAAGNINWSNPRPLPDNPQLKMVQIGEALFKSKCTSCHLIGRNMTGPDLAHFMKRFSCDTLLVRGYSLHIPMYFSERNWLDWASPVEPHLADKLSALDQDLWKNQWLYFCNQKARYGSLGTSFPELTEADLTGIYQYIQRESDRRNLPLPEEAKLNDCIDSCMSYQQKKADLLKRKEMAEQKKDTLKRSSQPLSTHKQEPAVPQNNIPDDTIPVAPPVKNNSPTIDFNNIVDPSSRSSLYYQFSIESFGWFNVDVLIKEVDGSVKTNLFVRVTGEFREKTEVFLIIPSTKTYTQGGLSAIRPDQMVFAYKDGSIYLPPQREAYILAISESNKSLAYSIRKFITGTEQELEISPQSGDVESFNQTLRQMNWGGLNIKAQETENGRQLNQMETAIKDLEKALEEVEKYRPMNCDCDCGLIRNEALTDTVNPGKAIFYTK